jgi:glutamyl-tRNA(Gln) amidotransferase subunit E
MYPETDVPVFALSETHWSEISSNLPPSVEQRRARLSACDISDNQVDALLGREEDELFHLGREGGLADGLGPLPDKAWAGLLLDRIQESIAAEANAPSAELIPLALIGYCLEAREAGGITREGLVPLVVRMLSSGDWDSNSDDSEALRAALSKRADELGVVPADSSDVEAVVDRILAERADFVAERGMGALGPLMGVVISELGGGADGKVVSAVLRQRLERLE